MITKNAHGSARGASQDYYKLTKNMKAGNKVMPEKTPEMKFKTDALAPKGSNRGDAQHSASMRGLETPEPLNSGAKNSIRRPSKPMTQDI